MIVYTCPGCGRQVAGGMQVPLPQCSDREHADGTVVKDMYPMGRRDSRRWMRLASSLVHEAIDSNDWLDGNVHPLSDAVNPRKR